MPGPPPASRSMSSRRMARRWPGSPFHLLPSSTSTTFTNIYRDGVRTQVVTALARPINPADLPAAWATRVVLLRAARGKEVPASWTAIFPRALLGVTPQGWMRRAGMPQATSARRAGRTWPAPAPRRRRRPQPREDVGGDDAYIAELASQARLLVITDGWHGATIYMGGPATDSAPPNIRGRSDRRRRCVRHLVPAAPGRNRRIRSSPHVSPMWRRPYLSRHPAWTASPIAHGSKNGWNRIRDAGTVTNHMRWRRGRRRESLSGVLCRI